MACLLRKDKMVVHKVAYFLLGEEPSTPIWDHDGPRFRAACKSRYEALGKRWQHLIIDHESTIDWQNSGCFMIKVNSEGSQVIKHVDGLEVQTPDKMVLDEQWKLQENWLEKSAKLVKGNGSRMISIMAHLEELGHQHVLIHELPKVEFPVPAPSGPEEGDPE
eukprot:913407-Lingulodinium_polyedra.AAC.1